jgi:hypothetical protein
MKLKSVHYSFLLAILTVFSGCEVIGGIFKAGVWVGILVVVGIIALILFLIGRGKK